MQQGELAGKGIEKVLISIVHIFRKAEEVFNGLSRDKEVFKKTQIKLCFHMPFVF